MSANGGGSPRASHIQGSGGTSIEIAASPLEVRRGDKIAGSVHLRGGAKERFLERVCVELHEHWIETSGKDSHTHFKPRETVVLAETVTLAPGQQLTWPFEFRLPSEGRITSEMDREGWSLYAHAVIRWRVDPRHRLPLTVRPEKPIEALGAALARAGFSPISSTAEGSTVILNRRAPPHLSGLVEAIRFRCEPMGSRAHVSAEVNWQERGLHDILRSMLGRDRTVHEFTVSETDAHRMLTRLLAELGLSDLLS